MPAIRHNPRHCACQGRAADHSAKAGLGRLNRWARRAYTKKTTTAGCLADQAFCRTGIKELSWKQRRCPMMRKRGGEGRAVRGEAYRPEASFRSSLGADKFKS